MCAKNSVFTNCQFAISNQDDLGGLGRIEHDNQVVNCTFDSNDFMFLQSSVDPGDNNALVNCLITNTQTREAVDSNTVGWTYAYSAFYGNQNFPTPSGTGNISEDPLYTQILLSRRSLKAAALG